MYMTAKVSDFDCVLGKGGIRPSYMAMDVRGTQLPTWKNGTTEATKLDIYGEVPTNKRLGFIW